MTQQLPEPNALIMGTGARSAAFKNFGDKVSGTILTSKTRQQTEPAGKLKIFPDGNPMLEVVITLLTELQEDDDDDGLRTVYAKGQMLNAIRAAVVKVGEKGIADGGRLVVQYTSEIPPSTKGFSATKVYKARYEAPVNTTVLPDQSDDEDEPF